MSDNQVNEELVTLGQAWETIKAKTVAIEEDLAKASRGVQSAGTRARKGLRSLRGDVTALIKLTHMHAKAVAAERKAAKAASK